VKPQSPASKFAERILVGTIETIARGLAKGAESIAGDVKKALKNEAAKVEAVQKTIEAWRQVRLGEVDDLPDSLRDDDAARTVNGKVVG
jgi:hypothetical protein